MIVIYLSKLKSFNTCRRLTQQINLNGNLDRARNTKMFFIYEEAQETVLDLSL